MSAAERRHYHHGRSPAAWTGSVIAGIAFVIGAIAAMMGPNWTMVYVSVGLLVVAGIATLVLKKQGLGNS